MSPCLICADFRSGVRTQRRDFCRLEEIATSAARGCTSCSLACKCSTQFKEFWGDCFSDQKHVKIHPAVYCREEDSITIVLRRAQDANRRSHEELHLEAYIVPVTGPMPPFRYQKTLMMSHSFLRRCERPNVSAWMQAV